MAGNSFGYKHSVETINKLKKIFSKESHPKFGSTASVAGGSETKKAISVAGGSGIKNYYSNNSHIRKGLRRSRKLSPQYGIGGTFVFCYNKTGWRSMN